jgi:site-specific DNA-methyltransferase (adenine-specific)
MIHHGDALAVLAAMRANTYDGCLTDPPYGLAFMGKAWDRSVPAADVWRALCRVMTPGAHLLVFGGTRTHHRLMCAVEDGGFELVDVLMWIHGQGFPKAKSQLKPAWEPIILARKRGAIRPLAIDASRIGTTKSVPASVSRTCSHIFGFGIKTGAESGHNPNIGRWPANVILDADSAAVLDAQSGTLKSGASRFFYCAKASPAERNGNTHPTVKPLRLTEYLARLILPEGGGRLIVPFAGSGSEMLGAKRAGWRVDGIEREREYVEIAARRMAA